MFDSKFYFGVVEDVDDPEQMGRVRVRIFYAHTENKSEIPTESLEWAYPIESGGVVDGLGTNKQYVNGSHVIVILVDTNGIKKQPIILGSFRSKSVEKRNPNIGFSDPDGVYPKLLDESEIHRLARGEIKDTAIEKRNSSLENGIKSAFGSSWSETKSNYGTEYPYNSVTYSIGGHIIEMDSTPDNNRFHIFQQSGSFVEWQHNGKKVEKIVDDSETIIHGDKKQLIKKSYFNTIIGDSNNKIGKLKVECGDTKLEFGVVSVSTSNISINSGETTWTLPTLNISGNVNVSGNLTISGTASAPLVKTGSLLPLSGGGVVSGSISHATRSTTADCC